MHQAESFAGVFRTGSAAFWYSESFSSRKSMVTRILLNHKGQDETMDSPGLSAREYAYRIHSQAIQAGNQRFFQIAVCKFALRPVLN